MNGVKICAWILIVLQVIGMIGTLINGGDLLNISFENVYVFMIDFAGALGYYAVGILGVVFLTLSHRIEKSDAKKTKQETNASTAPEELQNQYKKILLKEKSLHFLVASLVIATLIFLLIFLNYHNGRSFDTTLLCAVLGVPVVLLFVSLCLGISSRKKFHPKQAKFKTKKRKALNKKRTKAVVCVFCLFCIFVSLSAFSLYFITGRNGTAPQSGEFVFSYRIHTRYTGDYVLLVENQFGGILKNNQVVAEPKSMFFLSFTVTTEESSKSVPKSFFKPEHGRNAKQGFSMFVDGEEFAIDAQIHQVMFDYDKLLVTLCASVIAISLLTLILCKFSINPFALLFGFLSMLTKKSVVKIRSFKKIAGNVKNATNPPKKKTKGNATALKSFVRKMVGFAKKHSTFLLRGALAFVALLVLCTTINCVLAINACDDQEFIKAKRYQDRVFGYGLLFPEQRAYALAGVLLEEGKYFEAYSALLEIEKIPVPISILDKARNGIYSEAKKLFESESSENIDSAQDKFEIISDYNRSADYLILIKAKTSPEFALSHYNDIFKMLDLDGAGDVILTHNDTAIRFLKGVWKSPSGKQFEINSKDSASFSLPSIYKNDYKRPYTIENGAYVIRYYDSPYHLKYVLFKFTIINENKISVYCEADGSTYTLNRQ